MCPHFWRIIAAALMLILLSPSQGSATDIKTKHGEIYTGVKILGRDKTSLEISGPRGGMLKIPLANIAEIDGIKLAEPPPAAAPATASQPLQPTVAPTTANQPFNAKPTPAPTADTFITSTPAGVPIEEPPVGSAVASPATTGSVGNGSATSSYDTDVVEGEWILGAIVAGVIVWLVTLLLVWLDMRREKEKSWRWLFVTGLLPIIGYVVYLIATRTKSAKGGTRSTSRTEKAPEFEFLDENNNLIAIKPGAEASGIQNAKDILNDALLDRASDVHIEPSGKEYRVRFRVDGMLYPRMKFGTEEGIRLVSALKSMAQIDIAERRKAQDGRFGGRRGPREVDFRVATTPSVYGEKLVIRILDSKTGLRGLSDLGMTEQMMAQFAQIIQSRNGMILATGPTGSGKTSTLYAALTQLDAVGLNLVTIEDPVEYQLAGATQIPVNVRAGVTYESGLRSVLRQDPDVILVGEMRDREAAQIALRSALTGHLVFSSLHTQNAIGTITRLEEIGIERHLVASSLFVVIAQRLVRIICPHCREAYECVGDELAEVGLELPAGSPVFRAKGCRRCDATGYLGRTGVFEMLVFDDELRQAVNDGAGETELYGMAHRKGYRGYREDAAMKILLGVTTVDEVLKAI